MTRFLTGCLLVVAAVFSGASSAPEGLRADNAPSKPCCARRGADSSCSKCCAPKAMPIEASIVTLAVRSSTADSCACLRENEPPALPASTSDSQFKKTTGLTPTQFKAQGIHLRKTLDGL